MTLTVPLASVRAADVATCGGKGANLGELIHAGFAVPDGFVLTTDAYAIAARDASLDQLEQLDQLVPLDPLAAADRLRAAAVPAPVAQAALAAYRAMGDGRVAVRSSATAEDLPGASFAGQQDTILGVTGEDALLDAIRRCWASLWNERAVAYRRANGVDDRMVSLAVVVQRMVDASAAGVLFTADPITGRRGRAVIDAVSGLGEALVSGAVDPDHYAVDAGGGEIERHLRADVAVLDDARVRELAAIGARVEAHFGAPQDIEFAIDVDKRLWLVQSRPITTLYPLPAAAPDPARDLRVYFSFNVAQGYFEPLTPMGMQAFRLIVSALATAIGARPRDPLAGPSVVVDAGQRLFVDLTGVFRNPLGRTGLQRALAAGEARSAAVFTALDADPRLAPGRGSRSQTLRRLLPIVIRSGIPTTALRLLARPDATRERILRELDSFARIDLPPTATSADRLDAFERLFSRASPRLFPRLLGMVVAGVLSYIVAGRLLGSRASEDDRRTLTRGLPHNPTTEMDLALWALAREVRADEPSRLALLDREPGALAVTYQQGALPPKLQTGFAAFLARYGFRSVGEIDVGVPRWSEEPAHLLGALANYLRLDDAAVAPDAQFARGTREAEAMAATLRSRVHGPRGVLLGFFLRRARALMGLREMPKFQIIRLLMAQGRELLRPVGVELATRGLLASADDVYFLSLREARAAVGGTDPRALVAERRAVYARESARRHIPRVLLSDGTDAEVALIPAREGGLRGTPASPGTVSGIARVIRSPRGARLEPGEILVAPSTDPGWTPLFLTAGGLVMEMGGMMSHGAVVAREYGIPAVVGLAGATDRIATGQRVTVDGSSGVVSIDDA